MTRDSMPDPERGQRSDSRLSLRDRRQSPSIPMPDRAKNTSHPRLISDPVPPVLLSNSALPGETDRHFVRGVEGCRNHPWLQRLERTPPRLRALGGAEGASEGREEIDRRLHPQIRRKSRFFKSNGFDAGPQIVGEAFSGGQDDLVPL